MKMHTALSLVVVVGSLPAACTTVPTEDSAQKESSFVSDNSGWYSDEDGDSYTNEFDCDDGNPAVHPGAPEDCSNQTDDDCDGDLDTNDSDCATFDGDGDGWSYAEDCDDTQAAIHPGATENCSNQIDEDCNGLIDIDDPACGDTNAGWYPDDDLDGYVVGADCDDSNPAVYPGAPEDCSNQIDDDCDQLIDSADPDCTAGAQRKGLDWSRLACFAPDGAPEGLRSYRNQNSPFHPG